MNPFVHPNDPESAIAEAVTPGPASRLTEIGPGIRLRAAWLTPSLAQQQRWCANALASTPDFYYVVDLDGRFCYVNQALAELLQRPAVSILGMDFFELGYPPELAATLQQQIAEAIRTRQRVSDEAYFTSPAGHAGYYEYVFTPVLDDAGVVEAVAGSARDITQRRTAEKALQLAYGQFETQSQQRIAELDQANRRLQAEVEERKTVEKMLLESQQLLRQLAAHREHVKEEERKRIAHEIHDELGQNLLALRIDVSRLQVRTGPSHPSLNRHLQRALQQIDLTIRSVRHAVNNLRPPVLDLGLYAAIKWQLRDFGHRTKIACVLSGDGKNFDKALDEPRAVAVFRIFQESLTNVARHANASHVCITLRADDDTLQMEISDDGVGIAEPAGHKSGSFGLVGIRERVSYLQGQLVIDSAPGKGTKLAVSIPCNGGLPDC
jgi:PAS domain S-box-containing protein